MNSTIFIPKIIRIGYQTRGDTYTKKLAYIIYYDQKNVLRKETSWQSWRDKKIEPQNFDNIPISGFVLNKKTGGYSSGWNHRQSYCRVYDPRGFEFEITIPNLLYILENTNSIKGKGLEGEFVYGWDKSDIILIPTGSSDYLEISNFTDMISKPESIAGKDLILGGRYKNNLNEELIYLGRFNVYEVSSWSKNYQQSKGLNYWFCKKSLNYKNEPYNQIIQLSSLSKKIIKTLSKECVDNYVDLIDEIEYRQDFSPIDYDKTSYKEYSMEELIQFLSSYHNNVIYYYDKNNKIKKGNLQKEYYYNQNSPYEFRNDNNIFIERNSLESLHNTYKFQKPITFYLKNGKSLKN